MKQKMARKIIRYCKRTRESFFEQFSENVWADQDGNRYIYINRGGKVLAVAHLDAVVEDGRAQLFISDKKNDFMVQSYALDDRLGVCILLDFLPGLGIDDFDILLTDNEETMGSTAAIFNTETQYNWIFEFDRRGKNAAVLYQYQDKDLVARLNSHDILVEKGSYSDIAELEWLQVKAINFSCGYNSEHSPKCNVYVSDIVSSLERFVKFYNEFKNTVMPHTPKPINPAASSLISGRGRSFDMYDEEDLGWLNDKAVSPFSHCISCGETFDDFDLDANGMCPDCADWMSDNEEKISRR